MRSLLTALGIAVAVASFIALVGLSRSLERAWVNSLVERGTHILAVRKGAVEILTASINEAVAVELLQIKGVRAVAGELVALVTLEPGHTVIVTGWAMDCYLWQTLHLSKGELPDPKDPNGIVLGHITAELLGKEPGDTFRFLDTHLFIKGIFKQTGVMSNSTLVLQLSTLQHLLDRPGKVTEFNLRIDNPDNPEFVRALRARLADTFQDLVFYETSDIAENNDILRLLRAMAWATSTIALFIAQVVVLNTLLMSVIERTREIGILSAVGWSARRIMAMIVLEGLVLAMVGSAIGAVSGIFGLHYLATMPRLQGFFEFEITFQMVFEVWIATSVLGLLGSLYPAWRALHLNVVDALRYE